MAWDSLTKDLADANLRVIDSGSQDLLAKLTSGVPLPGSDEACTASRSWVTAARGNARRSFDTASVLLKKPCPNSVCARARTASAIVAQCSRPRIKRGPRTEREAKRRGVLTSSFRWVRASSVREA